MMRAQFVRRVMVLVWAVVLIPAVARAQAQGAIGGTVLDTTGAALPGVTVEVASDALIEKVRTAVTDGRGQYLIVDLRPGTYSVTFSLPGFRTVIRTGLTLSAGVTLPINAELAVGAVEETVTVTEATPVVDVANTRQQVVFDRELLDEIPRSRLPVLTAKLLPGVSSSASGTTASSGAASNGNIALGVHGGRPSDMSTNINGMEVRDYSNLGGQNSMMPSDASIQELAYSVSGVTAETSAGGIAINVVPKEGGNTVHGTFLADFSTEGWVADNLSDALRRSGLTAAEALDRVYGINPGLGGPVLRDRLWFFISYKKWGTSYFPPGAISEAKPTERAKGWEAYWSGNARLTWQATPRNKISVYSQSDGRTIPWRGLSRTTTAEAAQSVTWGKLWLGQVRWTSPMTNRVLLEVGLSRHEQEQRLGTSPLSKPGAYPVQDLATGKATGATNRRQVNPLENTLVMAAFSYVTGSHAVKIGFQHESAFKGRGHLETLPLLRVRNGVPFEAELEAKPAITGVKENHDLGLYGQDQWKLNRLTLNLGLRFDYLNAQLPEQNAPAGTCGVVGLSCIPARHFDPIKNLPNWKDLSPRLGVVYDLFGDGRTAIKASVGRYNVYENLLFAQSVNPLTQGSGSFSGAVDRRGWNDLNGDYIPQPNELGPSTNLNFGLPVLSVRADPALAEGWHKRYYNWEYSVGAQREVVAGLSASVSYYRRTFGNLLWTQNTLLQQSDFTPFTITSPLDGTPLTLYNLDPAKRGLTDSVLTPAPNDREIYDGVEMLVNGRVKKASVLGSATIGRLRSSSSTSRFGVSDTKNGCTTSDPNALRFCDVKAPFMKEAIYKAIVTYGLPFGVQASGVLQSLPGTMIAANYTVTSAIAGRPLTNSSILVNLVEPGSLYNDRVNEVDVRFAKLINVGRIKVQPSAEIFNVLNAAPVLVVNQTYGPNWRQPSSTLLGRMLKFSVGVDF